MESEIINSLTYNFESVSNQTEDGIHFWFARDLQQLLGYTKWDNFKNVILKAKTACELSNQNILDHFADVGKMVQIGSGATKEIDDIMLTRYACYLIAQNDDSRKKVIGLAQTYFAIQTRKQELLEKEYNSLTEDEKRFYQRNLTKKGNSSLNQTAPTAGVKNFDLFHLLM